MVKKTKSKIKEQNVSALDSALASAISKSNNDPKKKTVQANKPKAIEKPLSPAEKREKQDIEKALKTTSPATKNQLAKSLGVTVEMYINGELQKCNKLFESKLQRDLWLMANRTAYVKIVEWLD